MENGKKRAALLVCLLLLIGILCAAGAAAEGSDEAANEVRDGVSNEVQGEGTEEAAQEIKTGLVEEDGKWYYYNEYGDPGSGWLTVDGDTYYFDSYENYAAVTGLQYLFASDWESYGLFYFAKNGKMQTGWVTAEDHKYYFGEDGIALYGFLTIDGNTYYLSPAACTGSTYLTFEDDEKNGYYYFDSDGKMQTGWVTLEEEYSGSNDEPVRVKHRYYYGQDGKQLTGWQTIEGEKYYLMPYVQYGINTIYNSETGEYDRFYFDESGKMQTGWIILEEEDYWSGEPVKCKYYFGADGKGLYGWQTIGGDRYYFSYAAATGSYSIRDPETNQLDYYYFDEDGKMQTGWVVLTEQKSSWLDGEPETVDRRYYYGKDGKRVTGMVMIDGYQYDLDPYARTGLISFYNSEAQEDTFYFFAEDGKMQVGLVNTEDGIYYFNADTQSDDYGKAVSGWKQLKNDWYYFSQYDKKASTGLSHIDENLYCFDENGVMQTGWNNTGDYYGWRLFSEEGPLVASFAGMSSVTIPAEVDYMMSSLFAGVGRDFIIYCQPGSYAEEYALTYGFQYDNGQKRVVGYDIGNEEDKVKWIVENYTNDSMSDLEKVMALHNWLIYNAHYDYTYSSYYPDGVLLRGSGVCQSYAMAFADLLDEAGIENIYISGDADNGSGSGPQGHAWNMVKLGDSWYHVDTTWDDPTSSTGDLPVVSGWEGYSYFLVSDERIGRNHYWVARVQANETMIWTGTPGWKELEDGSMQYFDAEGILVIGPARIDGVLYGFAGDGRLMHPGWNKLGSTYCYAREGGVLLTDQWLKDGASWYYLGPDGKMQTGWLEDDGSRYYLDDSGAMATGWIFLDEKWYWLGADGAMQTGWAKAGDAWYFFNENGAMQTGWLFSDNCWYFLKDSGEMATGWVLSGNNWYWMGSSGEMTTGWAQIGGLWYFFNESGAMQTGWISAGGSWYWMDENGCMVTGQKTIDGFVNRFSESGEWLGYAE